MYDRKLIGADVEGRGLVVMGAEIRGEMQLRTKDFRLAASTGKRQERSRPESWSETARWYFEVL